MLEIITGGVRSSREKTFIDRICEAAAAGEQVLVIVPDQFSFEYDKKLYENLGARLFNSIETAGFDRMAEDIVERYGSRAKDTANDNAQIILMYRAVEKFAKGGGVKYFKKSLGKASFIGELIGLLPQLRRSGITPEMLQMAAERLEGTVSLKLLDLSRIYQIYMEELERANMKDSLSVMAEAAELCKKRPLFADKCVFVSAFNDFSFDEKQILDRCIKEGKSVTVSLLIDDGFASRCPTHPFDITIGTQQALVDMARAHNKNVRFARAEDRTGNSMEIMQLSERLFDLDRVRYKSSGDSVQVLAADDMYEEADYICAEICRLVREEGHSYNDIVITLRDMEIFSPVIESALERYDIPFFLDKRDSVDASAIVHYIDSIFKTVLTRRFKTENIMKLIRSPLFSMLNYEISDLEDYCIRWSVDGDMWTEDLTAEPDGCKLERINELRKQVMDPLIRFKEETKDCSAAEISKAFYRLLGELRLSEQTYSLVKRVSASDNDTDTEMSRGLKQLWTMSLSAVRSIYEILGDEKISLRRYYELYSLMLSRMKVSEPPQKLDCVRVIDAAHSRIDEVKTVFAAEVNDGIFPAAVKNRGLVTEHEKELLKQHEGLVIESNALSDLKHERLAAYSALCAPSDRLYVTFSRADLLGNEKRPSMLVKEVCEILGLDIQAINQLPVEFFCTSYKTAYNKYIEHSRDNTPEVLAIRESLMGSAYYYDKLSALRQANSDSPYRLSADGARETFFRSERAEVSPTKLDNYFKCPFMYFCNYGLRLSRSKKMDLDGLNKGLMIHDVLEKAIDTEGKTPEESRKSFLDMTEEQIADLIEECFAEYYEKQFCGDFGKNHTFAYRFTAMKQQAFNIVRYVQREMAAGDFSPVVTEYELTNEEGADHLDLTLKDGRHIVLIGTIDRADVYENENGERFVRIVDYKFRKQVNFSLAELYCGLNLQMLIYLSILLETGNPVNPRKDLKQAGVFYLKLIGDDISLSEDCELSEEALFDAACESAVNAFSRKGRISDISAVNEKLDSSLNKRSLTGLTMSDPMFTAMRIFAKRKVVEYGDRLLDGDIDAKPLDGVCAYCDYAGICGRAFPDDPVKGSDKQMKEALAAITAENERKGE